MVPSPEVCWNYFVSKCQDNLHVVLCMSPAGDTLRRCVPHDETPFALSLPCPGSRMPTRRRCRNFPGIVANTVIDWFFPWPESALEAVARSFMQAKEAKEQPLVPPEQLDAVVGHMVAVHSSVARFSLQFEQELRRVNHITPKNFLDYISTYKKTLAAQRGAAARALRLLRALAHRAPTRP